MAIRAIVRFIQHESFAGLLLMLAALIALIADNSPLNYFYSQALQYPLGHSTVLHFINHSLMTLFFISVGLEIKRELLIGELNSLKKASLPCFAALGGMLIPIMIFFTITHAHPLIWHGWAIPMATDIAFSLGIMSLLGKHCPLALKIFLMALATFDDLGAIGVIAIFYTVSVNISMLLLVLLSLSLLGLFNAYQVSAISPYLVAGALLWYFMRQAGIDPAISGIFIAFSVPLRTKDSHPAASLEKHLYPLVTYGVLPLFAFANAGVHLTNIHLSSFTNPLTLGIGLSLFIGKPLGIIFLSWLAVKCHLAVLPKNINWQQLTGVALLCGVGFTMSLFIGELAFATMPLSFSNDYRLGILLGSLGSGIAGYWYLKNGVE